MPNPSPDRARPLPIAPDDQANRALVAAVHPPEWVNPTPEGRYNLVVIGAGTAGLVTAAAAAGLGGRVALVERHLMGGDCLNVGCVPSKALLRSARAAAGARRAGDLGVTTGPVEVDFAAVMARMRALRASIAPVDSAARFRDLGVDVFLGEARFASDREVEVGGVRLPFARAVIATGARAAVPPIDGLEAAGYLTNDTVFELTSLPARLTVIGGGPIGCELAQAFARFGAQVTLIEAAPRILGKEDPDAAALVTRALERDGVRVLAGTSVTRVDADRTVVAGDHRVAGDAILVAVGRRPNTDGLGLEALGVEVGPTGVVVDDRLRTGNRRIYAAGDVCSPYQFTHAADEMARLVIRNALFFGRGRASSLLIPRVTFTDPEVAAVGVTGGSGVDTFDKPLDEVDRSIVDGDTEGFIRIHVRAGSDTVVGATLVGVHAGELIGELVLAMRHELGLGAIAATVHPYPTVALALRQTADQWSRTRLTPRVARLFRWLLRWRRR
jgi:pyruvate/2-oxoglutarate dehydrogenase complex dihydrolipoamide dehydrogenase (E3) component